MKTNQSPSRGPRRIREAIPDGNGASRRRRIFFHVIEKAVQNPPAGPDLTFRGGTVSAWKAWRRSFGREFHRALGLKPHPWRDKLRSVPLRSERIDREILPECIREKWIYDVEKGLSVSAWVCRPRGNDLRSLPAVLCLHGSGPGKDPLVGLWRGETCLEYHKRVGVRLAQAGFVTLIPDRRGFGECSCFPGSYPQPGDLKDLDAFYQRTRGAPLLALDIWDALHAVDFLRTLEGVNSAQIGCLGVEDGAPVAAAAAALHPFIHGAHLALFLDDTKYFIGPSQLPRLEGRAGSVELCNLICPKPLGVQILQSNSPLPLAGACRAARRVAASYRLAGCRANFEVRFFEGFYQLAFPIAADWFQRWLIPQTLSRL